MVLVIGVGNEYREDDGVGVWVARRLAAHGLRAVERSGEGAGLIDAWSGAARVIVVDAATAGAAPGTLHRFDATRTVLPRGVFRCSSHDFGVAEGIETARVLGRLPPALELYAIEGARFGHGTEMTPAVAAAAGRLVDDLLSVTEGWR